MPVYSKCFSCLTQEEDYRMKWVCQVVEKAKGTLFKVFAVFSWRYILNSHWQHERTWNFVVNINVWNNSTHFIVQNSWSIHPLSFFHGQPIKKYNEVIAWIFFSTEFCQVPYVEFLAFLMMLGPSSVFWKSQVGTKLTVYLTTIKIHNMAPIWAKRNDCPPLLQELKVSQSGKSPKLNVFASALTKTIKRFVENGLLTSRNDQDLPLLPRKALSQVISLWNPKLIRPSIWAQINATQSSSSRELQTWAVQERHWIRPLWSISCMGTTTSETQQAQEVCLGQEKHNWHQTSGGLCFGLMSPNLRFLLPPAVFLVTFPRCGFSMHGSHQEDGVGWLTGDIVESLLKM